MHGTERGDLRGFRLLLTVRAELGPNDLVEKIFDRIEGLMCT